MLWVMWSGVSLLGQAQPLRVLSSLCFCMPFITGMMYKTFNNLEEGYLYYSTVNMSLIFLSVSLLILVLLASWGVIQQSFITLCVMLTVILVGCFLSSNFMLFYILFELSLLPILYLIVGWGYQPERVQAGVYMVMYTVMASMPLLVFIFYLYTRYSSLDFFMLNYSGYIVPSVLSFLGFMAFLVKLPVYGVHVWLPKAHVEAPLGGSMILAGILLKLGGYGLYLYSSILALDMTALSSNIVVMLSMWGGGLAACACFNQSDIKAMIAYSSIVHMSVVVMGLLSYSSWGISSAVITMVGHGWASSGLFFLAFVTYSVVGSRSFNYTKGLLQVIPTLSGAWFIYCIWNMAVPPTINLLGELVAVPTSCLYSVKLMVVLLMVMFLSVAYNMYLYMYINHGAVSGYMKSSKTVSGLFQLVMMGHLTPLMFVFNMDLLCH